VQRRVARRVRWGGCRNVHSVRSEGALCPYPTASTGGTLLEVPTRQAKLSQFCHGCGQHVKKPLSQRWHQCACGIGPVQRDLYSAFLAAYLDADTLIPSCAQYVVPWEASEARLRAAHEQVQQRANEGQSLPQSMAVRRAGARRPKSLSQAILEPAFLARRGRLEAWKHRSEPPALQPGEPSGERLKEVTQIRCMRRVTQQRSQPKNLLQCAQR
jgi:hypothetical protein